MTDSVAFLYIRMKKIMIKQENDARKCEKNWLVKLERQTIDQKKIIRKADITMVDDERKTTKNEKMSMKENERLLIEKFKTIKPVEKSYEEQAKRRWKTVAKPLFSLGKLEDAVIRMAGIRRKADFEIRKKGLLIFCADNGVVSEGVTQTGQEVTAVVAENFLEGTTTCCVMCRQCGAELFPVDVGMVTDTKVRTDLKVAYGTRNMTREPAMTRDQAIRGIEAGIAMAEELKEKGYQMTSTVNDAYRVFSNNVTSPWVVDGKITVDDNIKNWVDMSKEMVDAGETATYELWSGARASSKTAMYSHISDLHGSSTSP